MGRYQGEVLFGFVIPTDILEMVGIKNLPPASDLRIKKICEQQVSFVGIPVDCFGMIGKEIHLPEPFDTPQKFITCIQNIRNIGLTMFLMSAEMIVLPFPEEYHVLWSPPSYS